MNSARRSILACRGTLFLCLLLSASAARAADVDQETAHAALREIRARYEKAVSTGDLAPLQPLFAPETSAVMTLGHEIKTFEDLQQHWSYVRSLIGASGVYTTTLEPEPSLIYGDTAIARGTSNDYVKTEDGREFRFNSQWTAVLRRVGDDWKVIRLHASIDPVSNVFVTAFMSATKRIYGLGGLAIGVIVGVPLGFLLKKRRASA